METFIQQLYQHDTIITEEQITQLIKEASEEYLFEVAEHLYHLGYIEEGNRIVSHLLVSYPDDEALLVLLCEGLTDLGKDDEALVIIHAHQESVPLLMIEADIYQQQGLYEVSQQKLQMALKLAPDEAIVHFALAELLMIQSEFLPAAHQYSEVLDLGMTEINGIVIHQRLGECFIQGADFTRAYEHLVKAVEQSRLPLHLFQLAYSAYQLDYIQEAIKRLEEVILMDPDYYSAYDLLIEIYEHEEKYEAALDIGQQALKHQEHSKELYALVGRLALRYGNTKEGIMYLMQALQLDDNYLEPRLLLLEYYNEYEDFEQALHYISQEETNDFEHNAYYNWEAARTYRGLEEDDKARYFYSQAMLQLHDNHDFIHDYIDYAYEISDMALQQQLAQYHHHG